VYYDLWKIPSSFGNNFFPFFPRATSLSLYLSRYIYNKKHRLFCCYEGMKMLYEKEKKNHCSNIFVSHFFARSAKYFHDGEKIPNVHDRIRHPMQHNFLVYPLTHFVMRRGFDGLTSNSESFCATIY
jgi:hypothetical protein